MHKFTCQTFDQSEISLVLKHDENRRYVQVYQKRYQVKSISLISSIVESFCLKSLQETPISILTEVNILIPSKLVNSTPKQTQDACLGLPFPFLKILRYPIPSLYGQADVC